MECGDLWGWLPGWAFRLRLTVDASSVTSTDMNFKIFSLDANYVHAEHCIGVLGTLALTHRQRGNASMAVRARCLS